MRMEQKTKITYSEFSKPIILGWVGGFIIYVVLFYITRGILEIDHFISGAISWSACWSIIMIVSLYHGGWGINIRIRDKFILLEAVISVWLGFFGMFLIAGMAPATREVLIFIGILLAMWLIIFAFKKNDIVESFRVSTEESYGRQKAYGFGAGFGGIFFGLIYGIFTILIAINRKEPGIIACSFLLIMAVVYLFIKGGESRIFIGKRRTAASGLLGGYGFVMFFVLVYYLAIGHL